MVNAKRPMGVTFGSLGVLGPRAIIDIARLAGQLGYRSIWTVEANGTDAFSLLGSVSAVAPGLELGTGIVPVQLRTPPLTAMSAATLQALSPDADIWLGLGVSAPGILQQHGVPTTDRPIAMMREYVALLRDCLSGESVTFEGDFWSVRRFRLGVRLGDRRPKIVMAALNPQMLKLAGEIADGVLLNYIPASHVGPSIERVRAGGDARIFAYVHAAVGDLQQSSGSARRDLFNYAMADGYASMFRKAGFSDEVDLLRERQSARDRDGALAAISDEMIQAIDFIGSADAVTNFVDAYVTAGVEYPILMPMPWGEDRRAVTEATMRAAIGAAI
ncbi:MAG: LLM class F420-dependent oxidoreductase [Proteobacteria bacterium]|nr:LLM class F420-dependent oxidoreductase [Pseudomonadota bacterium]MDA1298954.1 LLM class F420-dependent oxidoreductase [Pseudomonadota bacterium]